MGFKRYRQVKNPSFSCDPAEYEKDTTMGQFIHSLEQLDETIDRLERDDVYSETTAEAIREEVDDLIRQSHYLVLSKVELEERLRADERELG
jgi:hypothetical protein